MHNFSILKHLKLALSCSANPIKCVTMLCLRGKVKRWRLLNGEEGGLEGKLLKC